MREDGTSSTEIRQKLKKQGFKAPPISQLLKGSQHKGGRGKRAALDMVAKKRDCGTSEKEIRAELRQRGYKAARISQLLKGTKPEEQAHAEDAHR